MENTVACRNSQNEEIMGTVSCLERHRVVFEFSNPSIVLRLSERLCAFQIIFAGNPVYFGSAVVRNLVSNGLSTQCEASLDESWMEEEIKKQSDRAVGHGTAFEAFLEEWNQQRGVKSAFKLVVADLATFFLELRAWFQRLEAGLEFMDGQEREIAEKKILDTYSPPILEMMDHLFERFSDVASELTAAETVVHTAYMRRQLHPLVMGSPYPNRTYHKPLGYAGDYEMVNMILRSPFEGASLYAKVLNAWSLHLPPAEAHRNRIDRLHGRIREEALRVQAQGRRARILNFACGPAKEVQRFLASDVPVGAEFVLLDFDDETIAYARKQLDRIQRSAALHSQVRVIKKSVNQVFKDSARSREAPTGGRFDFVYCAGLFDYMTDSFCQHLMSIFYEWVAPGGLLLATNVESRNPQRFTMSYLLDWHLFNRDANDCRKIAPPMVAGDTMRIYSDLTGVNLFIEVRKDRHDHRPASNGCAIP